MSYISLPSFILNEEDIFKSNENGEPYLMKSPVIFTEKRKEKCLTCENHLASMQDIQDTYIYCPNCLDLHLNIQEENNESDIQSIEHF